MKNKIIKNVVYVTIIVFCVLGIVALSKTISSEVNYVKTINESGDYGEQFMKTYVSPAKTRIVFDVFALIGLSLVILENVFLLIKLDFQLVQKLKEKYEKNAPIRLAKKEERDAKRDEQKNQEKLDRIARLEKELQELKDD